MQFYPENQKVQLIISLLVKKILNDASPNK